MNRRKKWAVAGSIVILLLLGGYFAAVHFLSRFVHNGTLGELIGKKTAVKLGADAGYLPLDWTGMSITSGGLLAIGKPPRSLTILQATNLRAHCSLENLWERKWTVTRLQASHLQAAFGAAASTHIEKILPRDPTLQSQIETSSPLTLDIKETLLPRTDIFWGETPEAVGYIKDIEARFYLKGQDLDILGRNGTFGQTGWPEMKLEECRLHYAKPKLEVQAAVFSLGRPRDFELEGGFDFGEAGGMEMHVRSTNAPAEPFLKGFWKGKFNGDFDSNSDLTKKAGAAEKVSAGGEIKFVRAKVHDVAVLQQVAIITRHPDFEAPSFDALQWHYTWNGDRLEITEFLSEVRGLLRIEGRFSIDHNEIDGKFQVGVASDAVSAIPGAREKVFTEARDGLLWTNVKLSGPANHPREDLKERLVAAAEEHFSKGLLAPIFKPGKSVIQQLTDLYK